MLKITIPSGEFYDEAKGTFFSTKEQTLQLEHSLVSISKWESKWEKPFLCAQVKSREETVDYIRCMTLTQNVDPNVYRAITDEIIGEIRKYIEAPMTATRFRNNGGRRSHGIMTAERLYSQMITLGIPLECQKWHLNRLITLIRVCVAENTPAKKMSMHDIYRDNRALNAARRKRLNSKG